MGLLTGAGCVSRALGPVFVAAVYARRGPAAAFASTAALTLAALLVLRALYSRLRPPAVAPSTAPPTALPAAPPTAPTELQPLNTKPPDT